MGRKVVPGLYRRGGLWHIDKWIYGYGRLCESARTKDLEEAERFLAHRMEEIRQATVYGVRPKRTFAEAATEYLKRYQHKRSIDRDQQDLRWLVQFVGDLSLERVHNGSFERFKSEAVKRQLAAGTVNRALTLARRVLNLAAAAWRDEHGLSWLQTAPLIEPMPDGNRRKPYPLDWEEQRLLFSTLPSHIAEMALYAVNTGCREQEVCRLRWEWEIKVPELSTSVFLIPADFGGRTPRSGVKNKTERLVVLNSVAQSVVDAQRGRHAESVFTYPGRWGNSPRRPVTKIYNTAWHKARAKAADRYEKELGRPCPDGFRRVRVHDLKHTFGRRLRAAGVSFEDRQDLLGHKSNRVTTDYSAPELEQLIEAANKVTNMPSRKSPAILMLRTRARVSA